MHLKFKAIKKFKVLWGALARGNPRALFHCTSMHFFFCGGRGCRGDCHNTCINCCGDCHGEIVLDCHWDCQNLLSGHY